MENPFLLRNWLIVWQVMFIFARCTGGSGNIFNSVHNNWRHDLYSSSIILATVVNPNSVSVVPGLLAAVLFLEVMIGMGHSST
jgi:LEA14-like dessication related protein